MLDLRDTITRDEKILDGARLDYIRGLLVYVTYTYREKYIYSKGLHLTIYNWISHQDSEGWKIMGRDLEMVVLDEKWEMF